MKLEKIWREILKNSGRSFFLENGESFLYTIRDDSLYLEKNNWKISKEDIAAAIEYDSVSRTENKKLSYIYAILSQINE